MKKNKSPDDDEVMSDKELLEYVRYVAEDGCTITVVWEDVPRLNAKCRKLNRQFFNGRLPSYRIQVGEIAARSGYEAMLGFVKGHCDNSRRVITLGSTHYFTIAGYGKKHEQFVHETLLHEMCHIGLPSGVGHKEPFLRKLKHLYQLGEDWAGEQIKEYRFENRNSSQRRK